MIAKLRQPTWPMLVTTVASVGYRASSAAGRQVAFGGNLYSVPARKVRPRQLVEIRATKSQVILHSTVPDAGGETLLSVYPRAVGRGVVVKEDEYWDGLPTGKNRRTATGDVTPPLNRGHPRRGRPPSAVGL